MVVVAFVAVAMPCEASGSIKVLLLFSVLAKPERGVKVKLAISVVVRNSKSAKLILSSCLLDMYLRKGLQNLFKDAPKINSVSRRQDDTHKNSSH